MATSLINICQYNKFGHCRFGAKCRKQHCDVICESNSCDIFNCENRHPKRCKYWQEYGLCKFGSYCSYVHIASSEESLKLSIEIFRKELICIGTKVDDLKLEFCNSKEDLNEKFILLKDELETKWMDTSNQLTVLDEVAALHKQQVEVFSDEFSTYAEAIDGIEDKLCQLFPHVFTSTTIHGSVGFMSDPALPTPPPSNMKKRPP